MVAVRNEFQIGPAPVVTAGDHTNDRSDNPIDHIAKLTIEP